MAGDGERLGNVGSFDLERPPLQSALGGDEAEDQALESLHILRVARAVSEQTESFSSRTSAVRLEAVIHLDRIPL